MNSLQNCKHYYDVMQVIKLQHYHDVMQVIKFQHYYNVMKSLNCNIIITLCSH